MNGRQRQFRESRQRGITTTQDSMENSRNLGSYSTRTFVLGIAIALVFTGCPCKNTQSMVAVTAFAPIPLVRPFARVTLQSSAGDSLEFRERTPARRRSRTTTKKKGKRTGQSAAANPISAQEVAAHVASSYMNGSGGLYRQSVERRRRQAEQSSVFGSDASHQEQAAYLRKLDRHPALVLNADYQPLSVLPLSLWSWQDTIKAVFMGKVTVVETYKDVLIRAVTLDMPLPSVIALNEYVPQMHKRPAFTRRNVFLRDGYQCQYCKNFFRTPELSIDHVIPRCRGGKLEWENAVTCCRKCNGRKGSRIPQELEAIGMKLVRKPRCPSQYELSVEAGKMMPRKVHSTWSTYLGFGHEVCETPIGEHDAQTPSFMGQEEVQSGRIQ